MKKFWVILLSTLLLFLAACTNDTEPKEANGEEKKDEEKQEMAEQEAEVDMETLTKQITMDATIETTADSASFNFSLENTGEESVILGFTSGQLYEIQVMNEEGENVYTFSADKMFTQELKTNELAQDDVLEANETWSGIEEPGEYEVTMTFLVDTINDQPLEANLFQVTQSFTIETGVEEETEEQDDNTQEKETSSEYPGDGQAFRNIIVSGENGNYVVKGEARVFEGTFLYNVEDGHHVQVEPTVVQVNEGAPSWSAFEFNVDIAEEDLPVNGTLTLTLFEESAEDGRPTNVNYIPLENFQLEE